ncbi:hypothetical protein JCM8097_008635 [Rhodosporidiobolus ruineniae]
MRTVLALASLATLSGLASAQTGYGRFACTTVNPDGTFSANQAACADAALVAPGTNTPNAPVQGDRPNPTGSQCVIEPQTGAYFCGIQGAACTTSANCDNGVCTNGVCTGGFGATCGGVDSNCNGFLYCLAGDFTTTTDNTCGAVGAFCQDPDAVNPDFTPAEAQPLFNQFCVSGYCNSLSGDCDNLVALGADCTADPDFICGPTASCVNGVCVAGAVPSGRARQRRNHELQRKSLCPASHTACAVEGGKGFECIDTQTNLEQCGACSTTGGVDCTSLPGISQVGCVAGVCEIWGCLDGFEWNETAQACVPLAVAH